MGQAHGSGDPPPGETKSKMNESVAVATAGDIRLATHQKASPETEPFAVRKIHEVQDFPENRRWLIDEIWPIEGVGLLAASPKLGKTWLASEMGVAVASGSAFLSSFDVPEAGPVLMFSAEDHASDMKRRISGICRARDIDVATLNLSLIDSSTLTLNRSSEFARLKATVQDVRPKLLILDPFVRLHTGSENDVSSVSRVLGRLRSLQRDLRVAILVVHHVRKRDSGTTAGSAIRGSGDFHAWGDTSIFLKRRGQNVEMRVEHRAALSPEPYAIKLTGDTDVHLELVATDVVADQEEAAERDLGAEAVAFLQVHGQTNRDALRRHLGVRNERVGAVLEQLAVEGLAARDGRVWVAVPRSVPAPPLRGDGDGNGNEPGIIATVAEAEKPAAAAPPTVTPCEAPVPSEPLDIAEHVSVTAETLHAISLDGHCVGDVPTVVLEIVGEFELEPLTAVETAEHATEPPVRLPDALPLELPNSDVTAKEELVAAGLGVTGDASSDMLAWLDESSKT